MRLGIRNRAEAVSAVDRPENICNDKCRAREKRVGLNGGQGLVP